jgi:asparagine synthase (glutamine-hydrolysing)
MCGIAGFFGQTQLSTASSELLERMIATVSHRGPDDQGFHLETGIGLAHARLSIIDLVSGQQPMANANGSLWISFNGEIFNYLELRQVLSLRGYSFRTNSDTEVLLACYEEFGLDFVSHLNGDFAFALWDKRRNRLLLARDRMGVRPLFYTENKRGLFFASAIKALLAVPGIIAEPDPIALSQVFTFWHPLAPRTFFKDIAEIPPAHMLIATPDSVVVQRYWRLEFPDDVAARDTCDEAQAAEETYDLLLNATRIRMRSDVPVGSYLSGGLDSSAVTSMAQRIIPSRLSTFSVGFEQPEYDETPYQKTMTTMLGTDHKSVLCTRSQIGGMFPFVMQHVEQTILRTAPVPLFLLSRMVSESGLKVVLTGEGADEVFGGYDIFKEAKLRRFCSRQPTSRIRPLLLRRLYPYLPNLQKQSQNYLEAVFVRGASNTVDPLFSHLPRFRMSPGSIPFFSNSLQEKLKNYDPLDDLRDRLPPEFARWNSLAQAQYLETTYLLPGYILSSQGDRMAMGHGVETRFPFLDHRVVEFAARLPALFKIKGLREKHILRESFKNLLPREIVHRPKQPYRSPDSESFTGPCAPAYVKERLSPQEVSDAGLFNPIAVQKLVEKAERRGLDSSKDNMTFVGVLSTQLLHHSFVERHASQGLADSPSRA